MELSGVIYDVVVLDNTTVANYTSLTNGDINTGVSQAELIFPCNSSSSTHHKLSEAKWYVLGRKSLLFSLQTYHIVSAFDNCYFLLHFSGFLVVFLTS